MINDTDVREKLDSVQAISSRERTYRSLRHLDFHAGQADYMPILRDLQQSVLEDMENQLSQARADERRRCLEVVKDRMRFVPIGVRYIIEDAAKAISDLTT